jgi:integrase
MFFMCLEERPFHFEDYGEPFVYRSKFMKNLCAQAGVKPFVFHAIRHLASSLLFSMGYSVGTIQALLRHQNPNITAKYLKALGINDILDAVESLSAMGNISASGDDRQECRH